MLSNKIEFAMEVPTAHLDQLVDHVDWYFCIASYCLRDPEYFDWHINRPKDVRVMLDNGMYEDGKPLTCEELYQVALKIQPEVVFAPDVVGDKNLTLKLTEEFCSLVASSPDLFNTVVGVIPQGETPNDIVDCYQEMVQRDLVALHAPVGLSFLNDRQAVMKEMVLRGVMDPNQWYHLLGMYNTSEIVDWPRHLIRSMDTVKPLKAAIYGFDVDLCPRGLGKWQTNHKVEEPAQALMFSNIAKMHKRLTWRMV